MISCVDCTAMCVGNGWTILYPDFDRVLHRLRQLGRTIPGIAPVMIRQRQLRPGDAMIDGVSHRSYLPPLRYGFSVAGFAEWQET